MASARHGRGREEGAGVGAGREPYPALRCAIWSSATTWSVMTVRQ